MSNYIYQYNVWGEITYPFPDFNGAAIEVWERIGNFIPYFTGHVFTYLCRKRLWKDSIIPYIVWALYLNTLLLWLMTEARPTGNRVQELEVFPGVSSEQE